MLGRRASNTRQAVELTHCTLHGLRYASVIRDPSARITKANAMDMSGWQTRGAQASVIRRHGSGLVGEHESGVTHGDRRLCRRPGFGRHPTGQGPWEGPHTKNSANRERAGVSVGQGPGIGRRDGAVPSALPTGGRGRPFEVGVFAAEHRKSWLLHIQCTATCSLKLKLTSSSTIHHSSNLCIILRIRHCMRIADGTSVSIRALASVAERPMFRPTERSDRAGRRPARRAVTDEARVDPARPSGPSTFPCPGTVPGSCRRVVRPGAQLVT